jgi:hypothetical protein
VGPVVTTSRPTLVLPTILRPAIPCPPADRMGPVAVPAAEASAVASAVPPAADTVPAVADDIPAVTPPAPTEISPVNSPVTSAANEPVDPSAELPERSSGYLQCAEF